jgi:hypothetical protein
MDNTAQSVSAFVRQRKLHYAAAPLAAIAILFSSAAHAQGGPPYFTTDPGTPGPGNWEINFGCMPFLYNGLSTTHTPDVDINYGVGDRIQLTFENAWLRENMGADDTKYGLGQDQLGVKWRFYDNEENGLGISIFPQLSINNPNRSVQRGITPPGASLLLPMEFTKKVGPVDVNWELGYNVVHLGSNGWIGGLVVGKEITKKLELAAEFFGTGAFNHSTNQQTVDGGLRYKLRPPFILLLMAGRSVLPAQNTQPSFVGYFGVQILLPTKPFEE